MSDAPIDVIIRGVLTGGAWILIALAVRWVWKLLSRALTALFEK